jgi:DNA polymerase-1
MALNAPIQGSAADIIKKAMVILSDQLRQAGLRAEMLLQIHDELVLEVPDEELATVTELTKSVMERIVDLSVPLRVDTAAGETLADCEH